MISYEEASPSIVPTDDASLSPFKRLAGALSDAANAFAAAALSFQRFSAAAALSDWPDLDDDEPTRSS